MASAEPKTPPAGMASIAWWLVAAVALVVGTRGLSGPAVHVYAAAPTARTWSLWALLLGWAATIAIASLATWRLVRLSSYVALLPLAALALALVEPGRAGEAATWRLEWGVLGLFWTALAVVLFARVVRREDELERRVHLEGAAIAALLGVLGATAYALFEPLLPPLRAQWVAIALLLAWWLGWTAAARRYR